MNASSRDVFVLHPRNHGEPKIASANKADNTKQGANVFE